jgi:MFS family permease
MVPTESAARPGATTLGSAPRGRWTALALISAAEIGAMSTWFSAAAVAPALAREWHLAPAHLALLTVAVQLGFVAGALALAISGVADVLSTRGVFMTSAALAAGANGLLTVTNGDLRVAVPLRFALGFCLAGVYPPGMKLVTGWFRRDLGIAIGTLVGALTLGTALPHLVAGLGAVVAWRTVILTTTVGALCSAGIVAGFVRPGPFEAPAARVDLRWALRALRDPAVRLANFGYFGHMWELYAMWTWLPVFLGASFRASGMDPGGGAGRLASLTAALAISAGALGCIAAGVTADRVGRTATTAAAMALSGASAITCGLLFGRAPVLVALVAVVWGIAVIADSAQFSASVSELAERGRVGSALALQTALGFLLTAVSIQLLPALQRELTWTGALATLSLGPAFGAGAMLRLRRRPEAARLAAGHR